MIFTAQAHYLPQGKNTNVSHLPKTTLSPLPQQQITTWQNSELLNSHHGQINRAPNTHSLPGTALSPALRLCICICATAHPTPAFPLLSEGPLMHGVGSARRLISRLVACCTFWRTLHHHVGGGCSVSDSPIDHGK